MRARLWRRGALVAWAALTLLVMAAVLPVRAAEPAPEYAAATLDGQGDLSLADMRGDVVLLNGWATWCRPCREEMPLLEQLQQEYGDQGLRVVGVSIDRGDAAGKIEQFAADTGVTFTLLHDPKNAFARTFRTTGVPETMLIGRDGDAAPPLEGTAAGLRCRSRDHPGGAGRHDERHHGPGGADRDPRGLCRGVAQFPVAVCPAAHSRRMPGSSPACP